MRQEERWELLSRIFYKTIFVEITFFEKYLNPKMPSLLPNIKSQALFIEDTTSRYLYLLHVTAI